MSLLPPHTLDPSYKADHAAAWGPKAPNATTPQFEAQDYTGRNQATFTVRGDGRTESRISGVMQTSIAEVAASIPAPWSSARTKGGTPLMPHEVTGESIVNIPGFAAEVTLDQAYVLGLLPRPKSGGTPIPQVPQAVATDEQPNEELHPDLQDEPISREVEAKVGELTTAVGAGTQIQAVVELTEVGELSATTLAQAASQAGVEPHQIQQAVDELRPHFEKQANDAAGKFGVNPEAVWNWAREAKPGKMQDAIQRHLTMRNTQAYQELAKEYVRSLDTIDPNLILNAELNDGITVARDSRGTIVFTLADGRKMTWAEAVYSGGLDLSQRR